MRLSDIADLLPPEQDWMDHGACGDVDPAYFADSAPGLDDEAAIELCRRCAVREQCAAYADETNQPFGIWGGVRRG